IFKEGDKGEELYIIIEGDVEIRKSTYFSASKTLMNLRRGDIFGEMALIENKSRSATAVANTRTKLLILDKDAFDTVLEQNPDFAKKIIKILSKRLRHTNMVLQDLIVSNRENIVYEGLYQYAQEFGTTTFNGFRINEAKFIEWAYKRIGISEKDLTAIIKNLMADKKIFESALGPGEIVIKELRRRR
ncbi:MAG: cyclic nucleotide-binding domain-containing protein, partial [Spirochaetales bacterium]|nr:cyclic nucleotide-binding domain-containing protein [Spirochaetales bacterium]